MNIIELLKDAPVLVSEIIQTVSDAKKVLLKLKEDPDVEKVLQDISAIEEKIKAINPPSPSEPPAGAV